MSSTNNASHPSFAPTTPVPVPVSGHGHFHNRGDSAPPSSSFSFSSASPPFSKNPTPNKRKFGSSPVPYEVPTNITCPDMAHHMVQYILAGRILHQYNTTSSLTSSSSSTSRGILYEALSRSQATQRKQEQNNYYSNTIQEEEYYPPKIQILASQLKILEPTQNYICEGTMYRHTQFSWRDAPVEFQFAHEVQVVDSNDKNNTHNNIISSKNISNNNNSHNNKLKSICYEEKVESLTPFTCDVFCRDVWVKCPSCHKMDEEFQRWVSSSMMMNDSTHYQTATKRKVSEAFPMDDEDDDDVEMNENHNSNGQNNWDRKFKKCHRMRY